MKGTETPGRCTLNAAPYHARHCTCAHTPTCDTNDSHICVIRQSHICMCIYDRVIYGGGGEGPRRKACGPARRGRPECGRRHTPPPLRLNTPGPTGPVAHIRQESGLDCLICATFARQRQGRAWGYRGGGGGTSTNSMRPCTARSPGMRQKAHPRASNTPCGERGSTLCSASRSTLFCGVSFSSACVSIVSFSSACVSIVSAFCQLVSALCQLVSALCQPRSASQAVSEHLVHGSREHDLQHLVLRPHVRQLASAL